MKKDILFMSLLCVGCIAVLIAFVRRDQIRYAFLSFLAYQLLSWPLSMVMSLFHWSINIHRPFPKATDGSLILDFLMVPTIFTLFSVHYPNAAARKIKLLYIVCFVGATVLIDVVIARHSDLLTFKGLTWYWLILLYMITFPAGKTYVLWFFNKMDTKKDMP